MSKLTTYTPENVTNTKSFNNALATVFGGMAGRNKQVQQLIMISVLEATRTTDSGEISNNLDWLTDLLHKAEETKGINLQKLVQYVRALLCDTVVYTAKKKGGEKRLRLAPDTANKGKKLALRVNDELTNVSWFNFGKPEKVEHGFNKEVYLSKVAKKLEKEGALAEAKAVLSLIPTEKAA